MIGGLQQVPDGTRSFRTLCKSGGVEEQGAVQWPNSGTYVRMQHIYEADPNGSIPWTVSTVNAAQFGVELVS